MDSEITIITQIERTVNSHYRDWQIGTTNNPKSKKASVGNPLVWTHWQASTKRAANYIMFYFLQKGMHNAGTEPRPGEYVHPGFLADRAVLLPACFRMTASGSSSRMQP